MTASSDSAPGAAASAGASGSASGPVTPAGPEATIALRDLDERCARAERELRRILEEAGGYMDHDRVYGKVQGVSLVRSYIAEALRGAS